MIWEHFKTLETHSIQKDNESLIQIFLTLGISKAKWTKLDIRSKKIEGPPHVMFTMMKENIESMSAVSQLSKLIHKAPKNVQIAGNKDKWGITTQRVSVSYGNTTNIKLAVKKQEWNK